MPPRARKRTANVPVPRKRRAAAAKEETIRDLLVKHLQDAAEFTEGDQVPPRAILWTDPEQRWSAVIGDLRERMGALHTLGAWQPEDRTGPAIWLRSIEGRVLEHPLPADVTPV